MQNSNVKIFADPFFPTAYCLLPTAYCLLPTAYCLLPTAHCLLPTAYPPSNDPVSRNRMYRSFRSTWRPVRNTSVLALTHLFFWI